MGIQIQCFCIAGTWYARYQRLTVSGRNFPEVITEMGRQLPQLWPPLWWAVVPPPGDVND